MEIKKKNTGGRGAKSRVPDRPICNKYTVLLSSQHKLTPWPWLVRRDGSCRKKERKQSSSRFLFLFFNLSCDGSYGKLKKPKETETRKGEKGVKTLGVGLVCVVTWFMSAALKFLALGV